MATSEVQICNLALTRLGDQLITSLNEENDRAIACNTNYSTIRDAVLEDFPWHFAKKRAELSKLASAPLFGYSAAFQIPPDNLRVLCTDNDAIEWTVEDNALLTSRDTVKILYIRKVTDVTKFSATFVDALAERLASEIAVAVTGDKRLKDYHYQVYLRKIQNSETSSSQTGTPPTITSDTLIEARETGGSVPLAK